MNKGAVADDGVELWQANHDGLVGRHKGFGFPSVRREPLACIVRVGM